MPKRFQLVDRQKYQNSIPGIHSKIFLCFQPILNFSFLYYKHNQKPIAKGIFKLAFKK